LFRAELPLSEPVADQPEATMALIAALHVVVLTVVAVKISPATGRSTLIDNFETGEAPAKRRVNTNRNSKRRSCATPNGEA
jgi:hypothetical protein